MEKRERAEGGVAGLQVDSARDDPRMRERQVISLPLSSPLSLFISYMYACTKTCAREDGFYVSVFRSGLILHQAQKVFKSGLKFCIGLTYMLNRI